MYGHTIPREKEAAQSFEVGQRSLERLFPGITDDSSEQATLSASQSGTGYKRARDVARPAHLVALIAAKRKILDMIHGAATAGLLPELSWCAWILELRRPPPPSSSPLTTPEKPTARRYQQKAAQAAVDSRQQTIQGHSGTTITNPTVPEIEQSGAPPHRTTTTPNPPSLTEKSTQRTRAPCAALPAVWQNPTATLETRRAHQGSAAASDKE